MEPEERKLLTRKIDFRKLNPIFRQRHNAIRGAKRENSQDPRNERQVVIMSAIDNRLQCGLELILVSKLIRVDQRLNLIQLSKEGKRWLLIPRRWFLEVFDCRVKLYGVFVVFQELGGYCWVERDRGETLVDQARFEGIYA